MAPRVHLGRDVYDGLGEGIISLGGGMLLALAVRTLAGGGTAE